MGAWQGWWVTRVGVSSFIVTLAGMLYFRGISMIATNGATVAPLPKSLTGFATGFLPTGASIVVVIAALGLYAAFRLMEFRRARALEILERLGPALIRALAAAGDRRSHRALDRILAGHPLSRPARRHLHDRCGVPHAPDAIRRAALCDRRQSGSSPPLRHRPATDDLPEFRHRRAFSMASRGSR